jgi:hypothetical protein
MATVVADERFTLRDETLVIGVDVDALTIPVIPPGVRSWPELEENGRLLDVTLALQSFEEAVKSKSLAWLIGLPLRGTLLIFFGG